MARSTGYPCCEHEGVKKYGFNSEATCIYSCKDDCYCVCVEPGVTDICEWSFVGVNADGIAVAITADNYAEVMACCSEIYFTICPVKPRDCGKQRYFMKDLKIAGHCVNWDAMGADTDEKIQALTNIARRAGIHIIWPQIN